MRLLKLDFLRIRIFIDVFERMDAVRMEAAAVLRLFVGGQSFGLAADGDDAAFPCRAYAMRISAALADAGDVRTGRTGDIVQKAVVVHAHRVRAHVHRQVGGGIPRPPRCVGKSRIGNFRRLSPLLREPTRHFLHRAALYGLFAQYCNRGGLKRTD